MFRKFSKMGVIPTNKYDRKPPWQDVANILTEDGGFMLTEDGGAILLENEVKQIRLVPKRSSAIR